MSGRDNDHRNSDVDAQNGQVECFEGFSASFSIRDKVCVSPSTWFIRRAIESEPGRETFV